MLLATALVLPALSLDSLLCHFCPLQHKSKSCGNITAECLPDQRCSSDRGHYGLVHVLSSQSCVNRELCGSHEMISYRGVKYNVSHTCCCEDKCNSPPKNDSNLKKLLGMIPDNVTRALGEQLYDSCANYTSVTSNTSKK
uniref:protein Bouncer-like n=1 Tax=Solea senegalensis TaxID=28829 RepID=UPI001CD82E0E|nr:protein Bouncer-like [Solea senegalensis]